MENKKIPEESQEIPVLETPADATAEPVTEPESPAVPAEPVAAPEPVTSPAEPVAAPEPAPVPAAPVAATEPTPAPADNPEPMAAPAAPVAKPEPVIPAAPAPDATQVFQPAQVVKAAAAKLVAPKVNRQIDVDHQAVAQHELIHPDEDFLFFDKKKAPDEPFREVGDPNGEFDAMFRAAPNEYRDDYPERNPRPPRKGRPKRKKGYGLLGIPHILATAVWLAIIVAIGVSLGRMLWVCAADVLAFGRPDQEVSVTISSTDTIDDIAEKLHEAGLIKYPGVFKLYASLAVDDGEIASGTFQLNTLYDYHAIVNGMSSYSSFRNVVEDVVIPEGYNCRQIFALLEEKGICTVAELEEYAANGEFKDFWFLEGLERGDKYCLEGYLFPDTYDFYASSTPREALGKMLLGFEARFTEEMRGMLPALNERLAEMMRNNGCSQSFIDANRITMKELIIVASLIEEETASPLESPQIASVIYNRLTQDQSYERYLNIDAAIIYALGEHQNSLSSEDLKLDSPYNTYIYSGLTPTPISNPGLSSIQAALEFADTDYYYYVLNPQTGTHQFSKTLEEHESWRAQFAGVG